MRPPTRRPAGASRPARRTGCGAGWSTAHDRPTAPPRGLTALRPLLDAGATLAAETYGKGLGLDVKGQTAQLEAQLKLVVSDETKKNGLFTLTDDYITKIVTTIGNVGTQIAATDLFDLSLLKEIYAADPSLIKS